MKDNNIIIEIKNESERIIECCEYSSKAHFNYSAIWRKRHLTLSLPITIIATLTALIPDTNCKTFFAILTAILAAVQTVLKPQDNQQSHKYAGDNYLSLKNTVRRFKNIELYICDIKEALAYIKKFGELLDKLNTTSPSPSKSAYKKAQKGIKNGESKYKIDTENKE